MPSNSRTSKAFEIVVICFAVASFVFCAWDLYLVGDRATEILATYRIHTESLIADNLHVVAKNAKSSAIKTFVQESHTNGVAYIPPDSHPIHNMLIELAETAKAQFVFVMNQKGRVIATSNVATPTSFLGLNFGFRPYFTKALAAQVNAYVAIGAKTKQPGLFFAAPIYQGGDPIGVLVIKMANSVWRFPWPPAQGLFYGTDQNGVVFAANDKEHELKQLFFSGNTTTASEEDARYAGIKIMPVAIPHRFHAKRFVAINGLDANLVVYWPYSVRQLCGMIFAFMTFVGALSALLRRNNP